LLISIETNSVSIVMCSSIEKVLLTSILFYVNNFKESNAQFWIIIFLKIYSC